MQAEVSNHLTVLWSKAMVLSGKEKAGLTSQVSMKEMNDQVNLQQKRRNFLDPIKTGLLGIRPG